MAQFVPRVMVPMATPAPQHIQSLRNSIPSIWLSNYRSSSPANVTTQS